MLADSGCAIGSEYCRCPEAPYQKVLPRAPRLIKTGCAFGQMPLVATQ
ncbi:MAG: hypothetical protein M3Y55_10685 [Pseudomonadota bacterium]|nr:hypothetical protein [Pseudomonadota bacterium]